MKNPHRLLKTFQILTGLAAVVVVILGLALFGVIRLPGSDNPRPSSEEKQTVSKIKRPKIAANATYQEYLRQGDELKYQGNFEEATAAYQKASELESREYAPYEKIGDVYFLQKNYESALKNFDFAAQLARQSSALQMKAVRSLIGMRKILDAKIRLEKILPESQATLYYQGLIAAFLNDQEKAKDFLSKSLAESSDETLKTNAQKILTNFRDFELARDGRIEFLQTMLAQSFDQINEPGLAIELAFDALKTQHDYRDAWIVLGHAFLAENKWADSEDALKKAIELDASHPAAYFFRGIAKLKLAKPNEAIRDFEEALKFGFKPQIQAKQYLADAYFDLKNFEKAYSFYRDIVSTDPSDMERFVRPMALAINHVKKPLEALELARKAYENHPDTAMGHNLLGWAAFANDDLPAAHQHLSEAISRDPELAAAHLNFGQLLQKEGKNEEALREYQTAIDLAEKSGNESIGNTAMTRYNEIKTGSGEQKTGNSEMKNEPQREIIPPSLSLE
ncbi:tetratricopeptide repeat protein [Candidatus Peregrinibacteria bacterium]|nr:tetratricopeptide repeat protein [Candidatus Peregrinibacteria bacterium]